MPVAVVTGSSSGIGRATALRLARVGFEVLVHGHANLRGLQETARQIAAITGRQSCRAVTANIGCPASIKQLVASAFHWHPRIDAWINVAGADVLTGDFAEADFESRLDQLWRVDVAGTIGVSRLVAKHMQRYQQEDLPKPTIINIGWSQADTGMEGTPGQLFCTTKAAVQAFTLALARTHGPHVRINLVAPGWIQTKWGEQSSDYWSERAVQESLLKRWGRAEDVAQTIAWLASKESQFVNGCVIPVDGGFAGTLPAR